MVQPSYNMGLPQLAQSRGFSRVVLGPVKLIVNIDCHTNLVKKNLKTCWEFHRGTQCILIIFSPPCLIIPLRSTPPQPHPFPPPCPLCVLCSISRSNVCCSHIYSRVCVVYTLECGQPPRGHTLKQTDSTFLSQKSPTVNSSSVRQVGDLWALLPPFKICLADSWGVDNGFLGFFWWIPPFSQ